MLSNRFNGQGLNQNFHQQLDIFFFCIKLVFVQGNNDISTLIEQNKLLIDIVCQLKSEMILLRSEMANERDETKAILNRLLEKIGEVPKDTATSFKMILTATTDRTPQKLSKIEEFAEQANKKQLDRHSKKMAKLSFHKGKNIS